MTFLLIKIEYYFTGKKERMAYINISYSLFLNNNKILDKKISIKKKFSSYECGKTALM